MFGPWQYVYQEAHGGQAPGVNLCYKHLVDHLSLTEWLTQVDYEHLS